MVEIVGRAVRHPDLLHDAPGPEVGGDCVGHQSIEFQNLECMPHNRLGSFGGEAAPP